MNTDPSRLPEAIVDLEAIGQPPDELVLDATGATEGSLTVLDRSTFQVRARATAPQVAERAVDDLTMWVADQLAEQQTDVPEELRLKPQTLTPETRARQDGDIYEASAFYWIAGLGGATENPIGRDSGTVQILRVAVSTEEAQERVSFEAGPDVEYRISHDRRDLAPIVSLSISAPTAEGAEQAYRTVVEMMEAELELRQSRADVPAQRRIFLEPIAASGAPIEDQPFNIRPLVALLLSLIAAGCAAGALEWRDLRRQPSADSGDGSAGTDHSEGPEPSSVPGEPWSVGAPR